MISDQVMEGGGVTVSTYDGLDQCSAGMCITAAASILSLKDSSHMDVWPELSQELMELSAPPVGPRTPAH